MVIQLYGLFPGLSC